MSYCDSLLLILAGRLPMISSGDRPDVFASLSRYRPKERSLTMWFRWKPYVPAAKRKANAAAFAKKLAANEKRTLCPVIIDGRKIAATFWGEAWCDNLEAYSDFANRLPRGRTYVRNGSVIDLQIERGKIKALVSGSEVYRVTIEIS